MSIDVHYALPRAAAGLAQPGGPSLGKPGWPSLGKPAWRSQAITG